MPKIHYLHDGVVTSVSVPAGTSVMTAAVTNGVAGIVGECGGAAMCATCHVYVDDKWVDLLPPMSGPEDEMLDATASERRSTSRLGCQIKVTDAMSGLIVTTPLAQI